MKVFFDSNVYIAEALLGDAAERLIAATLAARWRVYACEYLLDEIHHVLVDELDFGSDLAGILQRRIARRSTVVTPRSSAQVPDDPKDSPILQASLSCGVDFLVTNDRHLLSLDPFEGLRIISMAKYVELLKSEGLWK